MQLDHTHDVGRTSWLASANDPACDFPIQNLPFAVFRRAGSDEAFRGGVAIGDQVIDTAKLAQIAGLPDDVIRAIQACAKPRLNDFLALGRPVWTALRHALFALLERGASGPGVDSVKAALIPLAEVKYAVPLTIGDYTDFYTSVHHAVNIGNLIRPDDPLTPNFRWIPIAYHGRVSSIGVSGQRVQRPHGQFIRAGAQTPVYAPCARLDYELELGVYVGCGTQAGTSLSVDEADAHIFGICLLNDWSARDIQWWEMAPLGPFLAKNFATTLSPWIVTMDALAPYRANWNRAADEPQPLDYLESERNREAGAIDIRLQVSLQSARARAAKRAPTRISETTFAHQYWSIAQMLAHHTSGGCPMNAGDLFGSGTISGPGDAEAGALIELSRGGQTPVDIGAGEKRSYLEDGDVVILRGWCERMGFARIGFGECRGEVTPARE
ncbi:fumarylacetoacetase [Burkholderia sp. S171]|uniref:fumarylacetoacetase n=1 Tax=Burkholderia sp. S171 TaxID=1641860 RepID=UPI00131DAAE1|nr:fumarylacetoacetase [Burkholderia sp. S171]